ncbi:response regulator [Flavobacterium sp.]|jgi:CheY-like chemotaxis protein|uniref:response regulator n=1 Tax=Flavobacterium sp. TaxID=239 RepID=UPI0037C08A36
MSNKVICIIDDDPIYRLLINKVISKSKIDYDIVSFTNGKEALESISSDLKENNTLSEIILLDLKMPIMDGWDFMENIDKILSDKKNATSIYIVTSSIAYEDQEKAKTFPEIMGYFSKPVNGTQILEITKKIEN